MKISSKSRHEGSTYIEALLVLSLLVVLLGVALPATDDAELDRGTRHVVNTYERVSAACARHLADTDRVALEFSAPTSTHHFTAPRYHHLSRPQKYTGWSGPYLDQPLSMADNPFGGAIYLMSDLMDYPALGFGFPGRPEVSGQGQYLVFERVPEKVAKAIDTHFDGESSAHAWQIRGKVEYSLDNDGTLSLFIFEK